MSSIPLLRPRDVIRTFEKLGWEVARQGGHPATLSVPKHAEIARGPRRGLIAKAGLTPTEFLAALES
jgi:hypothetical protein